MARIVTIDKLREDIRVILQDADVKTISAKKIRNQLEENYGEDLTDWKKEIDDIAITLLECFEDNVASKLANNVENLDMGQLSCSNEDNNAVKILEFEEHSSNDSDLDRNDEELARQLQEQESRRMRPSTARKTVATKKRSERQQRSKEGGSKKSGGKVFMLSPKLANVVGFDRMSRSDLVKRMWAIVKERNLTDPKQKSFMICDDELLKVFGRKRVRTFGMMKYLKDHMYTEEQYEEEFINH